MDRSYLRNYTEMQAIIKVLKFVMGVQPVGVISGYSNFLHK